jgi:hypothetical protein
MINNIELIKPLLKFNKDGDFYYLMILKRKKDENTNLSNHQSVRTIKTYCINSIDFLEKTMDEIITLCEVFKARAYIYLNSENHEDISHKMLIQLSKKIYSKQFNQKYLFSSVVHGKDSGSKTWIIDVDEKDEILLNNLKNNINSIQPIGEKIIATIPTKNGFHLITNKFNTLEFNKLNETVSIHKKSPTVLYLPQTIL